MERIWHYGVFFFYLEKCKWYMLFTDLWQANKDKNRFFLIFEIYFQMFEIHFLIFENIFKY